MKMILPMIVMTMFLHVVILFVVMTVRTIMRVIVLVVIMAMITVMSVCFAFASVATLRLRSWFALPLFLP